MIVVGGYDFTYIDCDDTLVSWDTHLINKYPERCLSFKTCDSDPGTLLLPIDESIHYLKETKKHGGTVVVWSAGGWEWAREVVNVLNLTDYVDLVISKPNRYVDDLPCSKFMGTWINKEPIFKKRIHNE